MARAPRALRAGQVWHPTWTNGQRASPWDGAWELREAEPAYSTVFGVQNEPIEGDNCRFWRLKNVISAT